jgi:hypothetical protein
MGWFNREKSAAKKANYISAKEVRRIARENRKVIGAFEKRRERRNMPNRNTPASARPEQRRGV